MRSYNTFSDAPDESDHRSRGYKWQNLGYGIATELAHRALVLGPKMISMRQLTHSQEPLDFSNIRWLLQMVSYCTVAPAFDSVVNAGYFHGAKYLTEKNNLRHSDLLAALCAIPLSAVNTQPVIYFEQQLQMTSANTFPGIADGVTAGDIYRGTGSWVLKKGLYDLIFLPANEAIIRRWRGQNDRRKQAIVGIILCFIVNFLVWPFHWLHAQQNMVDNQGKSTWDIIDDALGPHVLGTVYAGFWSHSIVYLIAGIFQGLLHGFLRAPAPRRQTNVSSEEWPLAESLV